MVRMCAPVVITTLVALAWICDMPAAAACGNGPGFLGCPPVGWAKSVPAAQAAAREKSEAYAIYFCAPESAATAGEGAAVLALSRVSNKNKILTIFDSPAVANELRKAGIMQLAKVAACESNAALMKQYGAGPNTLVICAPTSERLLAFAGEACKQATISSTVKNFPALYAAWQQSYKKRI
ncbi:MAG: hypothetical protein ABSE73_28230 [Planctomycetota bacterium]